jgi:hypothetical protein
MSTIELVDPELRDVLAPWPQVSLTAETLPRLRADATLPARIGPAWCAISGARSLPFLAAPPPSVGSTAGGRHTREEICYQE